MAIPLGEDFPSEFLVCDVKLSPQQHLGKPASSAPSVAQDLLIPVLVFDFAVHLPGELPNTPKKPSLQPKLTYAAA
eukprot:157672-Rhodomonas_salina.4